MHFIDLRSDTVTKPTKQMRDAMYHAEVGDDVFDDDKTLKDLEAYAADLFGKEAALFVTSGTQGNACALLAHTKRGDAVIIDPGSHIADHEAGSYAMLSGVSLRFPQSENGIMNPASVSNCITDDCDLQVARSGLIVVENAHSSGAVVPLQNMKEIYAIATSKNIPVHLDGARMFNAAAALGITNIKEMTQYCDTVMCCLSKGLCAPIGSILAGPKDVIMRAKKARKILGGGIRQGGILAAAGKLALSEMTKRVNEDHENAKYFADLLDKIEGITVYKNRLSINMIFFRTNWNDIKKKNYISFMLQNGIKVTPAMHDEYRLVTHHDITRTHLDQVASIMHSFADLP